MEGSLPPSRPDAEAAEPARFELLRELGRGRFGVVYEAHDRRRGGRVALKELHASDGEALRRFKDEFRALTDLVHSNVVSLYELHAREGRWCFTMEHIAGEPLIAWVRPGWGGTLAEPTLDLADADPAAHAEFTETGALDLSRLRDGFRQLAEGVQAIHDAGLVHRDLKPSNTLVADGRVVILDFGISHLVGDRDEARLGSPAYAAPEQATGEASQASDWYAFGSMLFEALTGTRPFQGPPSQVMHAKAHYEALRVQDLAPDAPADLAALCDALLHRDPSQRPTATEILRALGARRTPNRDAVFVGREAELGLLREALKGARRGFAAPVLLHGESGIGKTALVRRFLDRSGATVLWSRCHAREAVSFNALDGIVDALARRPDLPDVDGLSALARLFPVLRDRVRHASDTAESHALRRRAARALRGLLAAVPDVLLVIDDVQWGDEDSAALLAEVLSPSPPALLIATCRTEGLDAPVARVLLDRGAVRLPIGKLDPDEVDDLARRYGVDRTELRDAGGHPLFLEALARGGRANTLAEALSERISALPPDARALLEAVALVGVPTRREVLGRAAGLEAGDHAAVGHLRQARLVLIGPDDRLEPYHDRVREAVEASIPADRARLRHRALADAMEALGHGELEQRLAHRLAAGDHDRARALAVRCAEQAAAMLAWHREAELWQQALALGAPVRHRLADALARSGRGEQAANVYLEAAREVTGREAVDLRRRAAEQLLVCGRYDRGRALLREVCREVGIPWPSPALLVPQLLLQRRLLAWRGHDPSPAAGEDPDRALRMDVLATGEALTTSDALRSVNFQLALLRTALDAGDAPRAILGLLWDAHNHAATGGSGVADARRALASARRLAEGVDDPLVQARLILMEGVIPYFSGRFAEAEAAFSRAQQLLRARCDVAPLELSIAVQRGITSVVMQGRVAEVERELPARLADAHERSNVFELAYLHHTRAAYICPALDRVEEAGEALELSMRGAPEQGYSVFSLMRLFARSRIALYTGDPDRVLEQMDAQWSHLRWSGYLTAQYVAVLVRVLRGRAAVLRSDTLPRARRLAEADARFLERTGVAWALGQGLALRAGLAARAGAADEAHRLWDRAARALDESGLALEAAAVRMRLGQRERALAAFASLEVGDPDRLTRALAP